PQTAERVATARGKASERFNSIAPAAAPVNITTTERNRRTHRALLPPAREESAARPVMVRVKTVVVKSCSPIFPTVAFLIPIASAVRTISVYTRVESADGAR